MGVNYFWFYCDFATIYSVERQIETIGIGLFN